MYTVSTQNRKYELKARAARQRETRERIAAAAAELHAEVGVGQTTVADIARRAGVQRLTVYNHFSDLSELLPACSAHFMQLHPRPNVEQAFALEDPRARARAVLEGFYGWYRKTEPMMSNVQGERGAVPELDTWMRQSSDEPLRQLSAGLAAGFGLNGKQADRLRALMAVALSFWTWQRLDREGLSDEEAAELMTDSIAAVAAA